MQLALNYKAAEQKTLPKTTAGSPAEFLKLSKAEINALPIRAYEGDIVLVRDQNQLDGALNGLWQEKILGFDTETKPTFTKGPPSPPALIQLAGENHVYLFQLSQLAFGKELAELLAAPGIIKAGVAVRDDFRALNNLYPFEAGGEVDLAQVAKTKGIMAQGLRSLSATLLNFRISKSMQCSNWANPKLNQKQIKYAATDAWISREVYLALYGLRTF